MLWTIARKELLESLLSQRFLVSLLLAATVAWTSAFVLTVDYNDALHDYRARANFQQSMISTYFTQRAWDGAVMTPPKPPPHLSSLVRGVQQDMVFLKSLDANPVPLLFPLLDLLFITGIIMSVVALSFSYDRISGERDAGTLRQIASTGTPRSSMLFGKWVGGVLALLVILALMYVGSVLVTLSLSENRWGTNEWESIAALFLLGTLYGTAFYSLGLAVSAGTETPGESILGCLLGWILLTLIAPTLPPYIAELVHPTQSAARVQYEVFVTLKAKENAAVSAIMKPYAGAGMAEEQIRDITKAQRDSIVSAFEAQMDELKTTAVRGSLKRELIAASMHLLSPFSCYELAGAELTSTGVLNQFYFQSAAGKYVNALLREYLPQKVAQAKQRDAGYTTTTPLDIRDRPGFSYTEEAFPTRLIGAAGHTASILVYTALFMMMAWKRFIKYDVR